MDDGPDQSLSLAQGQAEHGSQCQRRGNRQIGVGGLPAGGGAWRGAPGRDRRLREPDCETATLAQGGVILGPVGHPLPLLGNVAATGCLGFERHDRDPSVRKGAVVLRRPAPDANRSIRATMSPKGDDRCQFSMPFNVALALTAKRVSFLDFTPENFAAPGIRRLMDLTTCRVDPALDAQYPAAWPARVEVTLADGGILSASVQHAKGDPRNPLSQDE